MEGYPGRLARSVVFMQRALSLFKATNKMEHLDQACIEASQFFVRDEDRQFSGRRWSGEVMILETLLCGKEEMSLDGCLEAAEACKVCVNDADVSLSGPQRILIVLLDALRRRRRATQFPAPVHNHLELLVDARAWTAKRGS